MELAYGLFMAEAEGYLNTREGRIQGTINDFVRYNRMGFDINNTALQLKVFRENNLSDLSDREMMRIKVAVENRI